MVFQSLYLPLNLLAILNIAILCLFLLLRKDNALANKVLAFALAIPGLYFVDNVLICLDVLKNVPYAFFAVQTIATFFPITVYWYIHLLLADKNRWHPLLIIGSVVTFSMSIWLMLYFESLSAEQKTNYLNLLKSEKYPITMTIYNLVFYGWQMVYLLVLYIEVKRYQVKAKDNLASLDGIKVAFAKQFVTLSAILNFTLIFLYLLLPTPVVDYGTLPVVVTVIYIFIIIFLMRNNAIFSKSTYAQLEENVKEIQNDENTNNIVDSSTERLKEVAEKIESALYTDRLFLDAELKLSKLASHINEPMYLTSQCLNSHFKKSFYDLVNELRISEAKTLLKSFDSKTDKIENIAYRAGFNSRASFYRAFKKIEGKNPTDFVSNS